MNIGEHDIFEDRVRRAASGAYTSLVCALLLGSLPGTLRAAEIYIGHPTDGTHRIDICLQWGMQCAGEAANVYCQAEGYDRALEWEVEQDIGAHSPTVVIGSGQVCAEAHCDGYFSIVCAREDDWTRSTGHGGLVVEVEPGGTLESTQGVMVVAVSEADERTAVAGAVSQYGLAFLHAPPGKYRVFALNWKNPQPITPQPGFPVDIFPGKDGAFVSMTFD